MTDIPDLLNCVPLESIVVYEGKDNYYITMENIRLALENCLQDHQYNHTVTIKGDLFIIDPAPEEVTA